MVQNNDTIPPVSWSEMEVILLGMASSENKRRMVRHLMEGARKQAPFMTAGGIMTELVYIAAAMLDVTFSPKLLDTDVSEASSWSSASPPSLRGS
nr:hypothetical protein [uncultured Brevundimonas sp.]